MQQYRNWQPQEPEHHYDMRALVFGVVSFLFCQLPVLSIGVLCSKATPHNSRLAA